MLPELSLNILDVAENSTKANAENVEIAVTVNTEADSLVITIKDDGCGMTEEELKSVENPFFTKRTTRRVGLGVPFFKEAAEITGGSFNITSEINVGTVVTAKFVLSSIDRMPMGDLTATIHQLITQNGETNISFTYDVNGAGFSLSTGDLYAVLGKCDLKTPEISSYIRDFLTENIKETNNGLII